MNIKDEFGDFVDITVNDDGTIEFAVLSPLADYRGGFVLRQDQSQQLAAWLAHITPTPQVLN